MPVFSIIVVHYQGSIPHEIFMRGINSLHAQTFRDFEILCYHDGPLLDASVEFPLPVTCTAARFNDWGHSLRDLGIRRATGDYIIHFNADNVLYPEALEMIAKEIRRPPRLFDPDTKEPGDTNEIIIFPIKLWGYQWLGGKYYRRKDPDFYLILTGVPPIVHNIDCMQFVMKRELWLAEGGWTDRSFYGDGNQYARFCEKYPQRFVGPVLGEHH